MFKKVIFLLSIFLCSQLYSQQNLVLNPSFEEVDGALKCYLYDAGKFPIANWSAASEGSIDAFSMKLSSKCIMYPLNDTFADQKPRTGNNFVGFTSIYNDKKEYREYVRGNLSQPLEVGATYKIQFYVCLSAFASAATNNIGLAFINNKTPIYKHVDPLPIKPDVNYSGKPITQSEKWTLLSFEYVATKPNLDAFVIGNFFSSAETDFKVISDQLPIESYMLIDDVSVTRMDITFDFPKEICAGTVIDLPNTAKNGAVGTWNTTFNPYKTQTYVFTTKDNSTVSYEIKVYPNLEFDLKPYCLNYQYQIEAKFKDEVSPKIKSYTWKLNNTSLKNTSLILNVSEFSNLVKEKNTVELTIVDVNGCEKQNRFTFSGNNLCVIQKEVSPNGDGKNDFLNLESFGGVGLKIFNRFGNVVYENENYINEWKGQLNDNSKLPTGEYYYQIENKTGELLNGWIKLVY